MKEVEHMIRTWVADVTSLLKKEKYLQYYKKVPDFRKEKADKIICQEGKALSIGVWILYEQMREAYDISEDLVFNLSHSGHYALCSITDIESNATYLGCDIEGVKQVRLDVARRFFLYVRISKNLGAGYGRGKSRGVLSLLGAEGEFYESN